MVFRSSPLDADRARAARRRRGHLIAMLCLLAAPVGCGTANFPTEANTAFVVGTLPPAAVGPRDELIGQAGNETGRCIYRTPTNRRFRAACPRDYGL